MQTRYIYMGFGLARCHWYQCMQSDRLSAAAAAGHSVDSNFRRDGALIYSLIVDLAHPCCAVDLLVLLYAHAAQIGTSSCLVMSTAHRRAVLGKVLT